MQDQAKMIVGFIHVAKINHWHIILNEQIEKLRKSGLFDITRTIYVTTLGSGDEKEILSDPKFDVVRLDSLTHYEFPSLMRMYEFCKSESSKIWYIHGKGVSYASMDRYKMEDWRRLMEYFCIERHSDCISALDSYDVCGVNWRTRRAPHFSGNFWWARSSYIKTLPDPRSINHNDRWQAEWWIGRNDKVRVKNFFESGVNHYLSHFPRDEYTSATTY